jgi:hypothetical protein
MPPAAKYRFKRIPPNIPPISPDVEPQRLMAEEG